MRDVKKTFKNVDGIEDVIKLIRTLQLLIFKHFYEKFPLSIVIKTTYNQHLS